MKRKHVLLTTVFCALLLSACAGQKDADTTSDSAQIESGDETVAETEETYVDETMSETEEAYVDEEASASTESEVWESPLGYVMSYDPTAFTLEMEEGTDRFSYQGDKDAPIYLVVQQYVDMDVETLTQGLILQSGMDDVEAVFAYFGADGIETQSVYYETEGEFESGTVKQVCLFYVIPQGEGALLVEIGTYVGVSQEVDWYFEEMLGTFSLTSEGGES